MKFIENPNLPDNNVKVVILDGRADKDVITSIEKQGIKIIFMPCCDDISEPVAGHPDMLFHHLGGNRALVYEPVASFIKKQLDEIGLEIVLFPIQTKLKKDYPFDIALNSARVGNFLICNMKYTDNNIIEYCSKNNIKLINTKQGYAKCSVCVVNKSSIITSDESIAEGAIRAGIDTLSIREGYISINDYEYGFIGGCCGKLAKDKLFFTGKIENHPDYENIKMFLAERNVTAVSLTDNSLIDLGSIIPIVEENYE